MVVIYLRWLFLFQLARRCSLAADPLLLLLLPGRRGQVCLEDELEGVLVSRQVDNLIGLNLHSLILCVRGALRVYFCGAQRTLQ